MSTTYFAWTFPVRKSDCRPDHRSLDSVSDLLSSDVAAGHTLMSASRNDWLSRAIARGASEFGASTLRFVDSVFSVLEPDAAARTAVEIEGLLEHAKLNPQKFADIFHQGDAAASVALALNTASSKYDPIHGPHGEEEGDGPVYFFAYLKCLLVVLGHANQQNLCIMHVRHEHGR